MTPNITIMTIDTPLNNTSASERKREIVMELEMAL